MRHLHPARNEGGNQKSSVCLCLGFHQKPKVHTNSEADTGHRSHSKALPTGVDIQTSIRRNEPNRPHISSDISNVKQRERQITTGCALTYWRARPSITLDFLLRLVCASSASPPRRRPVWRPVVRLSAAGEGAFTYTHQNPQAVFSQNLHFFVLNPPSA